jgi:hypothetical protein
MKTSAAKSAASASGSPRGTFTLSKPLQRKCACGSKSQSGAEQCDECSKSSSPLQAKMRVGGADDVLEREADQAADRALASAAPAQSVSSSPPEPLVRRRPSGTGSGAHDAPASVGDTLRSSGAPLDRGSRQFFESRFAHDFSRVRVHTGAPAEQSADEVGARAYTVGSDVVFARGEYSPNSSDGRRLLAHELAHVVQQDSASAPVVRRQPSKKREETARVLSLADMDQDPVRKQRRKDTGQDRAWIYRSTKPGGVKTSISLKAGDEVTIVEELPGGAWFSILGRGIPGFGPKEVLYVHSVFLRIIPHALIGDAKPIEAPPKAAEPPAKSAEPAAPPTKRQQLRALIENWPTRERWKGDERAPRTNAFINALRFSKYIWFQYPEHRAWVTEYITNYHKQHIETSFNTWEFEKKVGRRLANDQAYRRIFLGVRDGLTHLKRYAKGDGQGTAEHMWKLQIDAIEAAAEPVSVMLDDLKPGELKQTSQLQSLQSYEAPRAFLSGVLEGAKSQISHDDYRKLSEKLATSAVFALPLMPVATAGAVAGIAKDIKEQLEGIYELLTKPGEMAEQMALLITTLMFDKDGARQVGIAMGEQEGKDIAKLANEDIISFTFDLYKKVAPMVVSVVISMMSGGSAGAVRVSATLEKFLRSSKRASAIVKKIEAMLPEKKVPTLPHKPDAPDVPDIEPKKFKTPEIPHKTPDVPGTDAKAARQWAKEALDLSEETLQGLNPQAVKKLQALPEKDLKRLKGLSERARRYVLDCHSPCDIDGPDINERLAKNTNQQLEKQAKALEDSLKASPADKTDEIPATPTKTPDIQRAPTKEWVKSALNLGDQTADKLGTKGIQKLLELADEDLVRIRSLSRPAKRAIIGCGEACEVNLADIRKHLEKFTNQELDVMGHDGSLVPGLRVELTKKQMDRLRKVVDALNDDSKWGELLPRDRLRLGHVYDKTLGALVNEGYKRAGKGVIPNANIDAKFIEKLKATGGVTLMTEGRIKSLGMRLDMLEIDFGRKTADVVDIASTRSTKHVAKTRAYKQAVEKLLGPDFKVTAKEMLYTNAQTGELLEELQELIVQ